MDVLSAKLMALLGHKGWIGSEDFQPWQRDWLDQYGEVPLGVARPKSTAEVSEVLRLCHVESQWSPRVEILALLGRESLASLEA
ncbi:hypothetical protein OAC75_04575 [Pseudomonadales bacterium]|nr:hypothetical protein [Pseudomonadales bacterium]